MHDIENPDPENDIIRQLTSLAEAQVPTQSSSGLITYLLIRVPVRYFIT